jgi:inner membrane transporter RhtA
MKPLPRPSRRATLLPLLALLVAMVSIQYGATAAKSLFPLVGPAGTTALRLGAAAVMLAAAMRPWRVRLKRRDLPALIGYGATLGMMNLMFYEALRTIPLGIAVSIEFTGPLFVAVVSSRRKIDFAWVALAVCGLLLLSPPVRSGHALDPGGVAYALGAGACWALYIVFGQASGGVLGRQTTAIGTAIAACVVIPVGVVHAGAALLQPSVLLGACVVGFFSSALPYSLEMVALTRMKARVYGTLTSLEPALGALAGLVILHESLTLAQWAGIACVGGAAIGASTTGERAISPE